MVAKRAIQPTTSKAEYSSPSPQELEISLFGPGYGECIVVHYGDGLWFTVDSCLEEDKRTPSALAYLEAIGVNVAEQVTHNVITHPDGDHVGGIAKLFDECKSAKLVCPSILATKEMVKYITYFANNDPAALSQTTRELYNVLKLSTARAPKTPTFVKQDTLFINTPDMRVSALAPSDAKVGQFLAYVSTQTPDFKAERRGATQLRPNDVSAAILLEQNASNTNSSVQPFSAIFGADLEETPGKGWTSVLNTSLSYQAAQPAGAFKVAHHGSTNADAPQLWKNMNSPVAFLSPFKRGSTELPTSSDVKRILGHTNDAYSTSSFSTQKKKRLGRNDKILVRHNIHRYDLYPKNGHVRLRVDPKDGSVSVNLFNSAVHLSQVR
ncbi:MBL fold metallo-hydrolase [Magnetovibrio sp. PR-2]|uniref:MBL fold metallo-hydrolase n=1 Tax=Magnetovibrio sp. PR-2 TaxID=3120356 RepID=UPI002FCDECFC